MSLGPKRVLVATPEGETSRIISSVVVDSGASVVVAGSVPSASRIASNEPIDLVILDYDLLGSNILKEAPAASSLFMFPRLIMIANRETWGICDDAGISNQPEILWKPLDPEILLTKIYQQLDPTSIN